MELFVDLAARRLITSPADPRPLDVLRLGENAIEPLSVWLLAGQPLGGVAIPAPYDGLIVSARPETQLETGDPLFEVNSFAAAGAGATLHYEGVLDLETPALFAALRGRRTLPILLDVELVQLDGPLNTRVIMHAAGLVYRDIVRGAGGAVISGFAFVPVGDPAFLPANVPAFA